MAPEMMDKLADKLDHILHAIQSLAPSVTGSTKHTARPPSCTPCRNGPHCKYHRCGICWFQHPAEDNDIPKLDEARDFPKMIADLTANVDHLQEVIGDSIEDIDKNKGKLQLLQDKMSSMDEMITGAVQGSPLAQMSLADLQQHLNTSCDKALERSLDMIHARVNELEQKVADHVSTTADRFKYLEMIIGLASRAFTQQTANNNTKHADSKKRVSIIEDHGNFLSTQYERIGKDIDKMKAQLKDVKKVGQSLIDTTDQHAVMINHALRILGFPNSFDEDDD